ncbi:calpain-A isoform X2 [Anabrus simplex]|uniref:calpain-A isoform X2 n=1 Tax=Anabrus simplex TaxID=316456 RepID=UPI0035A36AD8
MAQLQLEGHQIYKVLRIRNAEGPMSLVQILSREVAILDALLRDGTMIYACRHRVQPSRSSPPQLITYARCQRYDHPPDTACIQPETVYKMFVKDGSGFISACDLRKALNSAGYRLNNRTLNILVHRYGTKNRTMSFDDFLMCTVKLKGMIDIFKESDPDGTNSATFTMDEWIINTIYS